MTQITLSQIGFLSGTLVTQIIRFVSQLSRTTYPDKSIGSPRCRTYNTIYLMLAYY